MHNLQKVCVTRNWKILKMHGLVEKSKYEYHIKWGPII